tara:strand:- start:1104 stop:2183 length:1080 start_codon:yes stop_codon:yes gene_type:complete
MKPADTNYSELQNNAFGEDNISILDIILVFARNIKIISTVPAILCLLTIIYALFFSQSIYTSTSKIMSSSTGGGGLSQAVGLAAEFGIRIPTGQSQPKWVYPEIIKSRTLARSVLNRQIITYQQESPQSLLQIILSDIDYSEIPLGKLETMGVDILLNMIKVSEDIKTSILTLNVNASDPILAAKINQLFIEELDAHQREYNKTKTGDTRQFIEERIKETEKDLMGAEENLKIFSDRNRRIENSPALQLERQRLTREVAVLTGVFTTLKQQLETTKIEEVKESDYVVVIDSPEVPLQRSKPNKTRMVILAGILGTGLGIFLAFIREFFVNSKKEDKDKISKVKSLLLKHIADFIPSKSQ